jgi:hypothetical protein
LGQGLQKNSKEKEPPTWPTTDGDSSEQARLKFVTSQILRNENSEMLQIEKTLTLFGHLDIYLI